MGNMWPMMKGFARDLAAYRSTLGKPIHQVKRGLNGKGTPLRALVATDVEAGHLQRLAGMRGLHFALDTVEGGYAVRLD